MSWSEAFKTTLPSRKFDTGDGGNNVQQTNNNTTEEMDEEE